MNYYGRTTAAPFPPGFADFLKAALREPPPHAPYRGPARFEQGDFVYRCRWERVYWLRFHGGVVR